MKPTREQLRELLRVVAATEPQEIDCEEFLARVGAYLEGMKPTGEPPAELRQVAQHLEICSECREEFDVLVDVYTRA